MSIMSRMNAALSRPVGGVPNTVQDYAGNNNGVNNGAKVAVVDGRGGLEFDGSNTIEVPQPTELVPGPSSFSIEFWAQVTGVGTFDLPLEWPAGDRIYVGKRNVSGWNFVATTDGVRSDTDEDSFVGDPSNTDIVFVQAVMDRQAGTQRLSVFEYGQWKQAQVTPPAGETNPSGALEIGSSAFPLLGFARDVRFWHIARTQDDANLDMHKRLTGNEPGLVGYWPMRFSAHL